MKSYLRASEVSPGGSPTIHVPRGTLQRKCACGGTPGPSGECAECRKKRLQRKAARTGPSNVPPIVDEVLRSSGQPLDAATRSFMEPRFGHDFGRVRVHADERAAESARAVDALAYTVGRDIVLDAGESARGAIPGRQLLAHELAHVVQQGNEPGDIALSGPEDQSEREAEAVARRVAVGEQAPVSIRAPGGLQRQTRTRKKPPTKPKGGNPIEAEDVAGIIAEQMQMWYAASRFGIQNASLEGDDDGAKWFLIALGGNLVWAATAFVAPEAVIAIRAMSVAGAAVGSGTVERLFDEDLPLGDFRTRAADSLGTAYRALKENGPALTAALEVLFAKSGLMARDDAKQAEQRRQLAWKFLFSDSLGYDNPRDLETNAKNDIEAIWRDFLPCWKSLYTIITPQFISENRPKYTLVCYYRALVSSGVADRSVGVRKTTLYRMGGGPDVIELGVEREEYEFPGGATATRTPGMQHLWWGNLTADVP